MAILLASNVLFVSCIGSFGLSNKVLAWNRSLGNKFVNELVYILFNIVPVYSVTLFADAVIFNTIEFWTGSNHFADATVKKVQGENGEFTIQTTENGYHIEAEGRNAAIDLVYDDSAKSWSYVYEGESHLLFVFDGEHAMVPMADGSAARVALDRLGLETFQNTLFSQRLVAER